MLGIPQAISAVSNLFGDIASRIAPNKDLVAKHDATAHAATMGQFAAEFQVQNRTWFDSLIDGLNRLPRPAAALGIIGLFAYAPYDPEHFIKIMIAFTAVPEWLAMLAGVVLGFYFSSRHLEKRLKIKGPDPERMAAVIEAARGAQALKAAPGVRPPVPVKPAARNPVVDAWGGDDPTDQD
jgi:uncharacterized protein YneF (UPF0154 family)